MSKNFEGEYKEYLNAQAPDLWDRIEAGVDAMGVVPIAEAKSKKEKKKRRIRYQNYRMIVSVAACLFALILVVPVYFLTQNTGKDAAAEAPAEAMDGAIENVVITNEESVAVTEEAAPAEEVVEDTAEVEIALEETDDVATEMAQASEEAEQVFEEIDSLSAGEDGQTGSSVALPQGQDEDMLTETAGEEKAVLQETIQVTILGVGEPAIDGVLYTASKADEASGQSLLLFVSADSGIVFEVNKMYRVAVETAEDGSYYKVVAVTAEE